MFKPTPKNRVLFVRSVMAVVLGVFVVLVLGIFNLGQTIQKANAVNSTLNFQARLQQVSGALVPDGNYNVEFKIYNTVSTGATAQGACTSACLWMETRTGANKVRVENGYLTADLGSITPFTTYSTIDWSQDLYLTMNIGGTGTPTYDGEMTPRLHLTATPYAFNADKLDGIDSTQFARQDAANTFTAANNFNLGLSASGAAINLNANSNFNVNIGTGTSTGAISIGGGASSLTIDSTNFDVSSAGVLSGITGYTQASGNFTVNGAGTSSFGGSLGVTGSTTLTGGVINPGATLNTAMALTDFSTNTNIGTGNGASAGTVDTHTAFTINQTTSGRTLTLPSPTTTTAGRVAMVSNIGTQTFTMHGVTVPTGSSVMYIWNGAAWTATGATPGVTTVGAFSNTASATGATISGTTITITAADATNPGAVSIGTQTFAGDKSFANNLTVTGSQLTNNGSTLLTAIAITDKATGGSIGANTATVDVATTFNVTQTTAGQTLSLPTPTSGTSGRLAYVVNTGSTSFVMHGVTILNGKAQTFIYSNSAWTATNIDGAGSGATSIGTFVPTTSYTNGANLSGNTLTLGAADATNPGIVSTTTQTFAGTKTFTGNIVGQLGLSVTGAAVNVNASSNFGVNIGTGTNNQLVAIGGGSGTFALDTTNIDISSAGAISGVTGYTQATGNFDASASTGTFATSTGNNTLNGNTTVASGKTFSALGTALFQNAANSTTAFQVQNVVGANLFAIDTTPDALNLLTNAGFEVNATGWTARSGTANFGRVTTQAYSGGAALGFDSSATNHGTNYAIQLTPSTAYTFSAYLKTATGSGSAIKLGYAADGATETTYLSGNQSYAGGGWTRVNYGFTTPGTVASNAYLFITSTGATARTFYVDNAALVSGSTSSTTTFLEGKAQLNSVLTTPVIVRNATDSTNAFSVQAASGSPVITADTLNSIVTIGNSGDTSAKLTVTTSSLKGIQIFQGGTGDMLSLFDSSGSSVKVFNVADEGLVTIRTNTNNAAGFQVQNTSGNEVFTVDTSTGGVTLGKASTINGKIVFQNSTNSNTTSIISGAATGNYTLTLPTALNGTGACLVDTNGSGLLGFVSCSNGVTTVGTFAAVSQPNGATISGNTITFGPADGTNPGMVSTAAQTFAGAKTFTGNIVGQAGLSVTGASTSINDSSNFATTINTGTSTGAVGIGNNTGNTALTLDSGTATIAIGTGAQARTINVGTGAAVVQTINVGGTGANVIAIGNTQTAGSVSIGAAMTTGTINIGGTGAQTGTINIGAGTGTQALNFGTGGVAPKTVTVGSTYGGSQTAITGGSSGGVSIGTGGSTNIGVDSSGRTVIKASSPSGAVLRVANSADTTTFFAVNENLSQNIFNSYVCLVTAGACSQGTNALFTVNGSVNLGAGGTHATWVTPASLASLSTRFLINNQDYTSNASALAIGMASGSDQSGRGIIVSDTRTFAVTGSNDYNMPIGVYSPNEATSGGFSWDGSATTFKVKTQSADIGSGTTAGIMLTSGNMTGGTGTTTGAVTIKSGDSVGNTNGNSGSVVIDAGAITGSGVAGTITLAGTNASAITLGRTGITTTAAGTLRIGAAAGSGSFVNNGSTVNTVLAVTDRNGSNGTYLSGLTSVASTTVDIYTAFTINQSTTSQTLQLPSPTSTTAGRIIYISNIGSTSLTLLGSTLANGSTATLIWNGSAWSYAGADGSSILNQNATDQTANFRINGTGRANGGFDVGAAGTLSLGTSIATGVTIGNVTNNTPITIDSGTGAINIGTGAQARTTNLGTGAAAQTVNIGSTNTTSATTINAGSGNINFNAGTAAFSEVTGSRTLTVQTRTTNLAGTGLTLIAGAAGAGATGLAGGSLTLQGGNAAGTTGNANGGDINLTGGTGVNSGVQGLVKLSASVFGAASTQSIATTSSVTQSVVDSNSTIPINATAGSLTITVPAPTSNVVGRILYIAAVSASNTFTLTPSGGTSFTMNANSTATLIWNGSVWSNAGVDGGSSSYIQNQNSVDQTTANFRINGTGRANGGFDVGTAGTLNLGTSVATAVTIGTATNNTPITIDSGTGAIAIGTGAQARTITIGTGAAAQTVTLGSTNGTSSTTIDSGTGAINIGTGAQARTTNLGTGAAAQTVNIGSTNTTSATTINAGSGNITFAAGTAQFAEVTGTRTLTVQTRTTNVAGSALTISAGTAGVGATAVAGGTLTMQGGNAAGTTGNANGGDLSLSGGAGVNSGVQGLVRLSASAFGAASTQSIGTTSSLALSVVDGFSTIPINATAGSLTITVPAPTSNVVGRILYVAAVSGSNTFTLTPSGGTSFTMNANSTATLIWNGSVWSNAGVDGGSSSYIQNQNTSDQTANFRISGTGTVGTGLGIGTTAPSRALDIVVNNTNVNSLPVSVQQNGAGDSGIQIANSSQGYYVGVDTSDTSAFKISSSTSSGGTGTIGYNTVGALTDNSNRNTMNAVKLVAPISGNITNLYAQVGGISTAPNNKAQMAVYSDSGGNPNSLLASTPDSTLVANSLNTFTLAAPLAVTSGTTYWVAYNTNGATNADNNLKYNNGTSGDSFYATPVTYNTWPGTFPGGALAAQQFSMYATINNGSAVDNLGTGLFRLSATGQALFKNYSNSTTAFQIQNAGGASLFNVDTSTSTVTVGSTAGTSATTIDSGTGAIGIGTSASARTINVGTGAAVVQTINVGGTGANVIAIGNTQTAGSVAIGAAMTTGTITIGGTGLQTGAINIGTGTGAQTLNFATGGTGAKTVTIGSTASTSSLLLQSSSIVQVGAATLNFTEVTGTRTIGVAQRTTAATAGTALTLQAGAGAATGAATTGGLLTIKGGNAAGATGNANGANVLIAGGNGFGTGVQGLVNLSTASFDSAAVQTLPSVGVNTVAASLVDAYSTIPITTSQVGAIASIADPTQSVIGRVIYVTARNASNDFTLRLNSARVAIDIAMKANSTATLIWNGSDWTAAGASSSTDLQSAYNNTLTSAGGAELVLNASGGAADGLTIRNNATTPINGGLFEVQTSIGTNLFSVNNYATDYATNGGAETSGSSTCTSGFPANTWAPVPAGGSCARSTTAGTFVNGQASVAVTTTTSAGTGIANRLTTTLTAGTLYQVSFASKLSSGSFATLNINYSKDGTATGLASCGGAQTLSTLVWTKTTCTFTPSATITSSNAIFFTQSDAGTARTFYVENLSVTAISTTSTPSNVQVGGGLYGGQPTLLTLDQFSAAPVSTGNTTYYGSMYYDTTSGRIQCYEADGWGACGSAPDGIITLTPEYSGATLNGNGIGVLTSDFCSNSAALTVGTLCATNDARNFYRWTSPQATLQTYSIYVTYKLPTTFKKFTSDTTITLTARSDAAVSGNGLVTYEAFNSVPAGSITRCGTGETTVTTADNSWQTVGINGSELSDTTNCNFVAGNNVIFKINVKAKSNANVYVENLNFTFTNT